MCRIYYEGRWYEGREVKEKIIEYQEKMTTVEIQKDEVVGLYMKRNMQMLFLIFALYDMGIPFLPLDIHAPEKRNNAIIKEAGIGKILANESCQLAAQVIRIELLERGKNRVAVSDIAYCIATSGTTGIPKIVQTGRKAFEFWMQDFSEFLELKQGGSIACLSEYTFDMFMIETLFARRYGMDILLANEKDTGNAVRLQKFIRQGKPAYLQATPSRMKMIGIVDWEYSCLVETQQVWLGGEKIGKELLERLQNTGKKIVNIYGPTETTVCCMAADVSEGEERIGRPLAHSRISLRNESGQEVQEGEICVEGECLFDGYRGQAGYHRERVYHTGDLAKRNGEDLIFIARKDFQVKLRGYRVELEEIESCLVGVAGVKDICVMAGEREELCAYYSADSKIEDEIFLRMAGQYLPDYMIPYKYIWVDSIPLTVSGKRDRDTLKKQHQKEEKKPGQQTENGDVESRILKMVQEKLEKEEITPESRLDESGVDSLLYVELLVEIEELFGMEFEDDKVSYKELNSVREIAEYVEGK